MLASPSDHSVLPQNQGSIWEGSNSSAWVGFEMELYSISLRKRKFQRSEETLNSDFVDSTFSRTATFHAVFYTVHGKDDVGLVRLGHVGWAGMVQNLVSIAVEFEDEPEKLPKAV